MARRSILLLTLLFVSAAAGACGDDAGSAAEQFTAPDEQEASAEESPADGATDDTVPTPTSPVAGPAVAAYCEGVADFAGSVDALVAEAVPDDTEVARLIAQVDELTSSLFEEASAEAGGSAELGDCVDDLDAAFAGFNDFVRS